MIMEEVALIKDKYLEVFHFVPPVAGFILAGEVINTFLDKEFR